MALYDVIAPVPETRRPMVRFSPFAWLRRRAKRMADRAELPQLSDRLLEDVGVTRAEVSHPEGRPNRDIPEHWRQRW